VPRPNLREAGVHARLAKELRLPAFAIEPGHSIATIGDKISFRRAGLLGKITLRSATSAEANQE